MRLFKCQSIIWFINVSGKAIGLDELTFHSQVNLSISQEPDLFVCTCIILWLSLSLSYVPCNELKQQFFREIKKKTWVKL